MRLLAIKEFCSKCFNNSYNLHFNRNSYFSHRLLIGPLTELRVPSETPNDKNRVGLFFAHSRLFAISREIFYQETKFHFRFDNDLKYFYTTLKDNLRWIRHISLLN